jgi:hypothetical protein
MNMQSLQTHDISSINTVLAIHYSWNYGIWKMKVQMVLVTYILYKQKILTV